MHQSRAPFDSTAFLKTVSIEPGIYQMFDAHDHVLYVGKARNLKKRLSSYFKPQGMSLKTQKLMEKVVRIDVTITHSENEALLLESNLIKKIKPKYNILLRDDKSYPYIFVSTQHEFPRIDVHRGAKSEKGRYFGPYPSGYAVRETLNTLQKLFLIRQCRDTFFNSRTRPCLQYEIKRCTGPCVGFIDKALYNESIRNAILFLEGKNQEIIKSFADKMEHASSAQHYEQAAKFRDQIIHLQQIAKQQYVTSDGGDIDVLAVAIEHGAACVHALFIRGGRIIGSRSYFPKSPDSITEQDVFDAFIPQFYLNSVRRDQVPQQVIINSELENKEWYENFLSELRDSKVQLTHAVRGKRAQWLKMAHTNAKLALSAKLCEKASMANRFEALTTALHLDALPQRIECFDISHSGGEATVASCVVFNHEGPLKNDYRRYNIHDVTPGDDYAAMKQAIERRYTKIKITEGALPDVLLIDGGKGQLTQALKVCEELQLIGVTIIGISKGEGRKAQYDKVVLPKQHDPITLPADSMALHLIQQIRDEAHRFAITGHRKQRDKKRVSSDLERIEGIGPKRRAALLKHFGGLQEIRRASVDDLAKVEGMSHELAQRLYDHLR